VNAGQAISRRTSGIRKMDGCMFIERVFSRKDAKAQSLPDSKYAFASFAALREIPI